MVSELVQSRAAICSSNALVQTGELELSKTLTSSRALSIQSPSDNRHEESEQTLRSPLKKPGIVCPSKTSWRPWTCGNSSLISCCPLLMIASVSHPPAKSTPYCDWWWDVCGYSGLISGRGSNSMTNSFFVLFSAIFLLAIALALVFTVAVTGGRRWSWRTGKDIGSDVGLRWTGDLRHWLSWCLEMRGLDRRHWCSWWLEMRGVVNSWSNN